MRINPVFYYHNLSCPQNEIETVLNLGVPPDRIIYANPCKVISHLKFAADKGVEMMTFDSESELHKIKEHFPGARLVEHNKFHNVSPSSFVPRLLSVLYTEIIEKLRGA